MSACLSIPFMSSLSTSSQPGHSMPFVSDWTTFDVNHCPSPQKSNIVAKRQQSSAVHVILDDRHDLPLSPHRGRVLQKGNMPMSSDDNGSNSLLSPSRKTSVVSGKPQPENQIPWLNDKDKPSQIQIPRTALLRDIKPLLHFDRETSSGNMESHKYAPPASKVVKTRKIPRNYQAKLSLAATHPSYYRPQTNSISDAPKESIAKNPNLAATDESLLRVAQIKRTYLAPIKQRPLAQPFPLRAAVPTAKSLGIADVKRHRGKIVDPSRCVRLQPTAPHVLVPNFQVPVPAKPSKPVHGKLKVVSSEVPWRVFNDPKWESTSDPVYWGPQNGQRVLNADTDLVHGNVMSVEAVIALPLGCGMIEVANFYEE